MKNLKLKKQKLVAFTLSITTLLFVILVLSAFVKKNSDASLLNKTDKDVFETIMFARGEGRILVNLPTLNNFAGRWYSSLNEPSKYALNKVQDIVITNIELSNPSFFRDFRMALRTKDSYIIQNEMLKANRVIMQEEIKLGSSIHANPDEGMDILVKRILLKSDKYKNLSSTSNLNFRLTNYSGKPTIFIYDPCSLAIVLVCGVVLDRGDPFVFVVDKGQTVQTLSLANEKIAKEIAQIDL